MLPWKFYVDPNLQKSFVLTKDQKRSINKESCSTSALPISLITRTLRTKVVCSVHPSLGYVSPQTMDGELRPGYVTASERCCGMFSKALVWGGQRDCYPFLVDPFSTLCRADRRCRRNPSSSVMLNAVLNCWGLWTTRNLR